MGLRVHAIWAEELKADASNIKWFEPTGEPDADYDDLQGVRMSDRCDRRRLRLRRRA